MCTLELDDMSDSSFIYLIRKYIKFSKKLLYILIVLKVRFKVVSITPVLF